MMGNSMLPFYAALGALALIALVLSLPYLLPPASIQECNKILSEETSYYSQPSNYVSCIRYVAAVKGDEGLCMHVSNEESRKDCVAMVFKAERGEELDYRYRDLDDAEAGICGTGYYHNSHTCAAIGLARQGN